MNAILLTAVLFAAPETKYVFVQSGCAPCHAMQEAVKAGDHEIRVEYINCDTVIPTGVAAFPTTYDPRSKKMHVGAMSLQQIKEWSRRRQPLASGEASHTPYSEVVRVIQLLPRPVVGFVDFGCGYDARWCVAAAEHWGCRVTGIELDPDRANAAKNRVRELGLSHLITIIEGDVTTVHVEADVGVAYLYPETLVRLRPRLERLRAFASYLHQPPLQATKNGDTWLYVQSTQVASPQQAVWGGRLYQHPVCNSPNCAMCNAIRGQLAARQSSVQRQPRLVMKRYCQGGRCWQQNEWVYE